MDNRLIFEGKATLEDLYTLHKCGYEFVISDGKITQIIVERGARNGSV